MVSTGFSFPAPLLGVVFRLTLSLLAFSGVGKSALTIQFIQSHFVRSLHTPAHTYPASSLTARVFVPGR